MERTNERHYADKKKSYQHLFCLPESLSHFKILNIYNQVHAHALSCGTVKKGKMKTHTPPTHNKCKDKELPAKLHMMSGNLQNVVAHYTLLMLQQYSFDVEKNKQTNRKYTKHTACFLYCSETNALFQELLLVEL